MALVTHLDIVEGVLRQHLDDLGADFVLYRNHVYRVANLCFALGSHDDVARQKIAVAAVHHDLGIWTDRTFDYIEPSVALAAAWLKRAGLSDWLADVEAMIVEHHKVFSYRGAAHPLVEDFRRADWIDVTYGLRNFGLPREVVRSVREHWPDAGFHRRLVQLTVERTRTHPLSPLPMVKW